MSNFVAVFSAAAGTPEFFDGIAISKKEEPTQRDFRGKLVDLPAGEWCSLRKLASNDFLASTDPSGFYTLFYTHAGLNDAGITAVSNSIQSLANYLADQGATVDIDEAYCLPILASSATFFNQAYSNRTTCRQIRRLGPDEEFLFGRSGGRVLKNSFFDLDDYETSLNDGIDASKALLQTLFARFGEKPITVNLSGGKDSRACLAILLASGIPRRKIHCVTKDPSAETLAYRRSIFEGDLRIASYLVQEHDLMWAVTNPGEATPLTFTESLSRWRDSRASSYFLYSPSFFAPVPTRVESLTVFGGGGEVLRSFWSAFVKRIAVGERISNTKASSKNDARRFFRSLVSSQLAGVAESAEIFAEEITKIPGDGFLEKIDNHYALHRNRCHFGHLREASERGTAIYSALSAPQFRSASRGLSFTDRASGRVIYDIIQRTSPELNTVEFESGDWPWLASRPAEGTDLRDYRDAIEQSKKNATATYTKHNGWRWDVKAEVSKRNTENLKELPDSLAIIAKEKMKTEHSSPNFLAKTESIACINRSEADFRVIAL